MEQGKLAGWLVGVAIGCALAIALDGWLAHPARLKEALPVLPLPGNLPPPVGEDAEHPQRIRPADPEQSIGTPPPMPAPMPMPNPVKHDAVRRLRVMGITPDGAALARAVLESGTETVDLLLKAGVEPGAVADAESAGMTPLMGAASAGNIAVMELLLAHGAALEAADAHGHRPLDYALFSRSGAAVEWLLGQGADASAPCCGGSGSALGHALESYAPECIAPLMAWEGALHPLEWNAEARTALYAAIRLGDQTMARLLLTHYPPPTPGISGTQSLKQPLKQPLMAYLIVWNRPGAFRFLLESGADANLRLGGPADRELLRGIPDEETRYYLQKEPGMTLLMLAAGLGRIDFVQMLLEHGARRGVLTGHYKMAAIHFAARNQHPEVMQVLLGKSPRPEDQRMRIDISLSAQRALLWRDDRLVMSAPVSTGRSGFSTPSGRYVVTDKEPHRYSTIYKVAMPYFMRLSCGEFGIHAGEVPNYPASHGCIRLPPDAAYSFYQAVDVGTLVTIRP